MSEEQKNEEPVKLKLDRLNIGLDLKPPYTISFKPGDFVDGEELRAKIESIAPGATEERRIPVLGLSPDERKLFDAALARREHSRKGLKRKRKVRDEIVGADAVFASFHVQGLATVCTLSIRRRIGGETEWLTLVGVATYNHHDDKPKVRLQTKRTVSSCEIGDKERVVMIRYEKVPVPVPSKGFDEKLGRLKALHRALLDGGRRSDVQPPI